MKLIKIYSDRVQIRTDLAEFQDICINDLLAVTDGKRDLVVTVTGLTDTDTEEYMDENDFLKEITGIKTIECSIIGSLKDGKFVKAIDAYPTTNVGIRMVGRQEFSEMLGDAGAVDAYLTGVF